jgi:glycosyltransferase involved in cell wall biosynthesis
MQEKKLRIAVLSDSPTLCTGYRNNMVQLCRHLEKAGHEIHYLANGYMGANLESVKLEGGEEFNYKIYAHGHNNQYFNQTMSQLLKQISPDRFIILLDTFMLFPWFQNIDTSPAKTFFWFPTDGGGGLPKGCEAILKKIDCPVAMSQFGQKQVKDYHNLEVAHIPHGVDSSAFYPLEEKDRNELRAKWGLSDKFVIGVVARNQPRKNLDRTIKTMKLVAEKIPNAILFLHLDPKDPAQPMFQIHELVKKHNLENRVVYSGMSAHSGFPQSEMNNIYNLMDCFFLSTSGEGFGIPIIEAMSCQVPVLATDYTTTQELIKDNKAGLGIKLSGVEQLDLFKLNQVEYDKLSLNGTMTGNWEVERGLCDIEHAACQIKFLYDHPQIAKSMGESGRNAVLTKYNFDLVGKAWEKIII